MNTAYELGQIIKEKNMWTASSYYIKTSQIIFHSLHLTR